MKPIDLYAGASDKTLYVTVVDEDDHAIDLTGASSWLLGQTADNGGRTIKVKGAILSGDPNVRFDSVGGLIDPVWLGNTTALFKMWVEVQKQNEQWDMSKPFYFRYLPIPPGTERESYIP